MASFSDIIIVQAGGKGTRLKKYTRNKPKCLLPVDNRPMLFHLFNLFPKSAFIIIGDSHYDVLSKYLAIYAYVDYQLVRATGHSGTLAGVEPALKMIPEDSPFTIIWSDLVLPEMLELPKADRNYIAICPDLPCRWKFEDGLICEEASSQHGIMGMFLMKDKSLLRDCPKEGQLVKYFSGFADSFHTFSIPGTREFGLLDAYERLPRPKCRPFNKIDEIDGKLRKSAVTPQGEELIKKEIAFYMAARDMDIAIPKIYSRDPLVMEKIDGTTIAELRNPPLAVQEYILAEVVGALAKMHNQAETPTDLNRWRKALFLKTIKRLESIQSLVPFASDRVIVINGRACRNFLFHKDECENILKQYFPDKFSFIHGDPTFSNIMVDSLGSIKFIDPRGYFGGSSLYGDAAYDYAKLYYSLFGCYDMFNKRHFNLFINSDNVGLYIHSNGWRIKEASYLAMLPKNISPGKIHIFNALIWLSLTTYAWEDYDAICGAFYNGSRLFEDALHEHDI